MKARKRSKAEGLFRHVVAWGYSAAYVPILVTACLAAPRSKRDRVWPAMVRSWGRNMLRIGGVSLEIDAEAQARLADRRARVLLFNHSSTLDVFVGAALLPDGGVLVLKREFIWVPILGPAAWAVGSIFVDRRDGDRARASLARAVARTQRDRLQILIAPEGTRMTGPTLGRFKLGAFQLARDADIEILPVVLHHCRRFWPRGAFAPEAGKLLVTTLDEVSVAGADREQLRVIADGVRERYIEEMARIAVVTPQA